MLMAPSIRSFFIAFAFLSVGLLSNPGLFAQDTTYAYFDMKWKPVKKKEAFYARKMWQQPDGNWQVHDHFADGTPQMFGTFRDRELQVRIGDFTFFHPNGQKDEVQHYDEAGNQTGPSTSWYDNGHLKEELNWRNDTLDGSAVYYHQNGQIFYATTYRMGKVAAKEKEACFNEDGQPIVCRPDRMPEFPGGSTVLKNFLIQNVVYPKKARDRNVQGRTMIRFSVLPDGSLRTPVVEESSGSALLDAEALRVVLLLPRWEPALYQGKATEAYFRIPITFMLN